MENYSKQTKELLKKNINKNTARKLANQIFKCEEELWYDWRHAYGEFRTNQQKKEWNELIKLLKKINEICDAIN